MSLTAWLRNDYPSTVRHRGDEYVRQGRVRIRSGSDTRVEASVRGSTEYGVEIIYDGGISLWCDCGYFSSNGACKHLWATLVVAEARGYLSAVRRRPDTVLPAFPEFSLA